MLEEIARRRQAHFSGCPTGVCATSPRRSGRGGPSVRPGHGHPGETRQATPCPPAIFPLHFQDSPDGLPALAPLSLEPTLHKLHKTLAHDRADPACAEPPALTHACTAHRDTPHKESALLCWGDRMWTSPLPPCPYEASARVAAPSGIASATLSCNAWWGASTPRMQEAHAAAATFHDRYRYGKGTR